jgi:hypothetical protein
MRWLMAAKGISINRAPVLTLWAAVVGQRLGYSEEESLSLAQATTALNAQSKGPRLGIFKRGEAKPEKSAPKRRSPAVLIPFLGRSVPAVTTREGVRAVLEEKGIQPPGCSATWRGISATTSNEPDQRSHGLPRAIPRPRWPVTPTSYTSNSALRFLPGCGVGAPEESSTSV